MTVLKTHGVGVAWATAAPVLEDVCVTLDRGFYGLVGANGAGKTTLLAVLAGLLKPHEGSVSVTPRDATIAYCPQRVEAPGADVTALAASEEAIAAELRGRLELDASELLRWPTLSPGERKRWQVGAALAHEPDVLLLDEPTNHLDSEARQRLLTALRRFRGIGVVVSHDRALLDELTVATLRVHARRVTAYPGSYSRARALWLAERAQAEAERSAAKTRIEQVERKLSAARRTQAAAERGISAGARMKDKNDSDARGILATNRASWADARAGRTVRATQSELARARAALPSVERDPTLGGKLFAAYERAPSSVLFHLSRPQILAGSAVVLRDVRLSIGREERVRIVGANGAGKTTLLSALLEGFPRPDKFLHLPQEPSAAEVQALSLRLARASSEEKGRTLSIFAALGSEPERILAGGPSTFSPGEARKLALAEALGRQVWALVLDEPTNHLDLPSIERLEAALEQYPGCLLLVSHDDAFAERLTTRQLRLEGGRVF